MAFKLTNVKLDALIHHDDANGVYTITILGNGAPIVSASTIEEAKAKFESALKLSSAVKNLLYFKGATESATPKTRRIFLDGIKEKIGNIEYHEMAPC
jgi:hypothetical protein